MLIPNKSPCNWDEVDYMIPDALNAIRIGCKKGTVAHHRRKRGWPPGIFWTRTRIFWHSLDWRKPNGIIQQETGRPYHQVDQARRKVFKDRLKYIKYRKPMVVPSEPYITKDNEL